MFLIIEKSEEKSFNFSQYLACIVKNENSENHKPAK